MSFFAADNKSALKNQDIKLAVVDLKKVWLIICDGSHFNTSKKTKPNFEITIKLESVLGLQSRDIILDAFKYKNIQLIGEPTLITTIKNCY